MGRRTIIMNNTMTGIVINVEPAITPAAKAEP